MAQSFTTDSGQTIYDPGTYVTPKVISNQTGVAAAGVVTIIGEANEGPHWSEEPDLNENTFAPDEINDVIQKYGSGRIVDAFRGLVSSSADAAITGTVTEVKIIKTNASTGATSVISRSGFGNFATVSARRKGSPGNLIKYSSAVAQTEVAPATGTFTYCPTYTGASTIAAKIAVDGKAPLSVSVAPLVSGETLKGLIETSSSELMCNGGDFSDPLTGLAGINVTATVASGLLTLSLAAGSVFADAPAVGDCVVIGAAGEFGAVADSVVIGAADANAGSYIVTAVGNTISSAFVTLSPVNINGVAPVAVPAAAISANEDEFRVIAPMSITHMRGQVRAVSTTVSDWSATTNDGTNVSMASTEAWDAIPQVGDIVKFAADWATVAAGYYTVVSASNVVAGGIISMSRLSDGTSIAAGSAVTGVVFAGIVMKPVIDGTGKSMEFNGDLSDIFFNSDLSPVNFSNSLLVSASEYVNSMTVSRGTTSDIFESGGDIVLKVGNIDSTDSYFVIDEEKIEFYSDSALAFTATFSQFLIMEDLVDFIGSQSGWTAEVAKSKFLFKAPSDLDRGTYYCGSELGLLPARIKTDAASLLESVNGSGLATFALDGQSGLPETINPPIFLSGGTKAGSTALAFSNAIDAAANITTNFIVPLVSQDAIEDIALGETESSSTYTVDAINALIRSHVIAQSCLKARKNRIGIGSKIGSFDEQQDASGDVSSFRFGLCIQEVKKVNSSGVIQTFQPWMTAIVAAGMQAGAGYLGIVKKFANVNGLLHSDGSYNPKSWSAREKALKAGLLVMEPVTTGGYRWTSDQMTYTVDNNFVYNSLQAVYISDLMTLTLIDSFDRTIVGQSVADMSAPAAKGLLQAELFNFKRLKWITASDDAPLGYKNISVKLVGGVMRMSVEVKLAGLIYFVPINLAISQVTQEA